MRLHRNAKADLLRRVPLFAGLSKRNSSSWANRRDKLTSAKGER